MLEAHILVTGEVQGVGFRSAIRKHALEHRIHGYVRNLTDGRVEICAQGDEEQIKAFLNAIQSNPGRAVISQMEKTTKPVKTSFSRFEIS